MINTLKFLIFLICTIFIFFVNNYLILCSIFIINILFIVIYNRKAKNLEDVQKEKYINLKDMFSNFLLLLPFILFTVFINIIFESLRFGVLIGVRLIICYNITYTFSKNLSIMEFAKVIEMICYPLKLLKINTSNIGIIVAISICMIPVFKSEILGLIKAMNAKGMKLNISNISILMKPLLIQVLRKTSQVEKTLIAKAYVE